MSTRALTALAFLLGGCTIHVVEQPSTAQHAPAAWSTEPPRQTPRRVSRSHHDQPPAPVAEAPRPRPDPIAEAPRPQPDPRKPSRADTAPVRKPPKSEPSASQPLYRPFRDVGSSAVSTGEPPPPARIKKVKKAGT